MASGAGREAAVGENRRLEDVRRVSGSRRFSALRRSRHTCRRGPLRIAWVPADDQAGAAGPAVAYAIGRRVGTAVARNRLRRRLRAAMTEAGPAPGDYLVHADPAAASLPYPDLKALVNDALDVLSTSRDAS